MGSSRPWLAASIVMLLSAACWPQDTEVEELRKENAELKQRLDKVETELGDLKDLLTKQRSSTPPADAPRTSGSNLSDADLDKIRECVRAQLKLEEGVQPVTSAFAAHLYGYVKLDAAYDTHRTVPGNYVRYVESEGVRENDGQMNLTANQTRLGIKVRGPDAAGAKSGAVVEADFYGGGPENRANPRMRHAYMQFDWADCDLSLLAGQTWDVIAPLDPNMLNCGSVWNAGNIGYRRPQIRLTKGFSCSDDVKTKLEAAIARNIGRDGPYDPGDTGEDAGYPVFQGRASVTFPGFGPKPTTIGFSGHWGREEWDRDAVDGVHTMLDTWSLNVDLQQPVTRWLSIKGEAFAGANLDGYSGGIGQGIDPVTLDEIRSWGGWIAANIQPCGPDGKAARWSFNVGGGLEAINDGDLVLATERKMNSAIFVNAFYRLSANAMIGFEVSSWRTDYYGIDDGDSLRFQTSFIYNF